MASRTFRVPSISCGHCVRAIQRELGALPGVSAVNADAGTKVVTVEWTESETSWDTIRDLLIEIQYPPEET